MAVPKNLLKYYVNQQIGKLSEEDRHKPFIITKDGNVIPLEDCYTVSGYQLTCTPDLITADFVKWLEDNEEE